MSLQLVSLFAGVGGFDIAAERAGIDPVVACEIDPQARGVLQHRLPNTTLINDVKDVTGERLTELGLDPRRTVITGGFPCQDLSIAGKQAGLEGGERSSLFFEIVRILREFNPQWFILENVPGLLSSKGGRDMGIVVGSLAELGYSFSWRILDAQNFGVPQRRRRVFIVGHFGADETRAEQVLFEPEGSGRNLEAGQSQGQDVTGDAAPSVDSDSYRMLSFGEYEPDDTASALKARDYKDATDKQSDGDVRLYDDISPTVTRTWGTGGNNVPMIETIGFSHTQGIDAQPSTTAFPTLRREGNGHAVASVVYPIDTRNALRDPEKKDAVNRQGLGVGKAGDPSSTLTNLFVPAVAVAEEKEMQTYPTLSASNNPSQSPQSSEVTAQIDAMVKATSVVRRLTPVECERLQGFPDGWSAQRIDHKKGVVVDQADSSRYKQMGNAVAVPVVEWIFNRLVLSEETK
jgi:DNA (cytosine-5)-methyltransferase 1